MTERTGSEERAALQVDFRAVDLAVPVPLLTSRGGLGARRSWIVRASRSEQPRVSQPPDLVPTPTARGYGEAAPLPGFGGGDPDLVENALARIAQELGRVLWPPADPAGPAELAALSERLAEALPGDAAARSGVMLALADLAACSAGKPLATWLETSARDSVPVNGVVGAISPSDAAREALELARAGYSTLKLKVGAGLEADVERVAAVRAAVGPDLRLRLDANGAWTFDQARLALARLAPFGIEYFEQPGPPGEVAALAELRRLGAGLVAADEALLARGGPEALETAAAADVWVLKPSLLGGPLRALELAGRAAAVGARAVVTTALDGAVGRLGALHVAAAIAGRGWDGGLAHGLATGARLEGDIFATPEPVAGRMAVPRLAGLGCPDLPGPWTSALEAGAAGSTTRPRSRSRHG